MDKAKISLDFALKDGFKRMKRILFEPFEISKWLIIGFAVFLYSLGQGIGGFHSNFHLPMGNNQQIQKDFGSAKDFFGDNTLPFILILIGGFLILFALMLIVVWLSSRGKFLVLHNLIENKGEIKNPWKNFGHLGDRLFFFRVIFYILTFLIVLILLTPFLILLFKAMKNDSFSVSFYIVFTLTILIVILFSLIIAIINAVLLDFVAPIMLKREVSTLSCFKIFYHDFLKGNFVSFLLFYLVKWGLSICCGIIILIVSCCTCCIAALPYISSVVFLPIFLFLECYTLSFLLQFGGDWNLYRWSLEDIKEEKEIPSSVEPIEEIQPIPEKEE
jgi:hypothetical protein